MMRGGTAIRGVVELAGESDPELRAQLALCAYRMSRGEVVALVLRGIDRLEADRILDPVVEAEGLDVRGVCYIDAEAALSEELLRHVTIAVAATDTFRSLLLGRGIHPFGAEQVGALAASGRGVIP
jgi:hypothetical protein